MPGDEQRQQLVAQLGVAHRAAVLVRGLQQQRHDVVALGQVRGGAALGDLRIDRAVDALKLAPERRHAGDALGAERHQGDPLEGVGDDVEQPAQLAAQLIHARPLGDAEHRPQDDLHRHRLHARAQRIGLAERPALDLPCGDFGHQRAVALHPLAVKRRQQQPALAQVRRVVE